ncbi:MAG: Asp-tRNA(Asn)/Glu-tRNA(Gln) amidotransferase subunit GatA, partial [Chitinivibrionales bacterium]|nr:Asp-tRNA(Asn)/Glu-tRNA(Gln) amidotransferase subunit GatA [Chitinivibrionales bacterium]
MSFLDEPVGDMAGKVKNGEMRSTDLVEQSLQAIAQVNPKINAYVSVLDEYARRRAATIDTLPAREKARMPLCGIPVAVKDNICTKDLPTTCSSKMLQDFRPPYNATVIEALERAGAVMVGKTNLDEFAMGSSTENSALGPTHNPCKHGYIAGGSSGGSAAAVAADTVPLAVGSDTGGSIRQPSSHCGVVGMKPTYGRVSRYGLVAFASSLDQIGPLARDVRDAGLLLDILSVPDERDSTNAGRAFHHDPTRYSESLEGLTIGKPVEYFAEGLADEVRSSVEKTAEELKQTGAKIVDISLPNMHHAIAAYYIICTAEASSNLARYDGVKYGFRSKNARTLKEMYERTREEGFGAEVKRRVMLGTYVLSSGYYDAYYLKAAKVRTLIKRDFEEAFTRCDAILSPVTPTPAFKIGEKCDDPLQMYLTDIYT